MAYKNRAIAYSNGKHDYDSAIADFSKAVQLNPKLTEAYIDRGIIYESKHDLDRALADFRAAIQLDPENAIAKQHLKRLGFSDADRRN